MPKHRLLVLIITLLWSHFPAVAGSGAAKRKGQAMTQRILFHPAPTADLVKNLKVETLGKIPKGTWFAADDATALELVKRDKSTQMLYPSREEYGESMEGLDAAQIAEAVNKRLQIWSAEAPSQVLPHLFEIEKTYLAKLAAGASDSKNDAKGLNGFYRRDLEILNLILIDSRFHYWKPGKLMEAAFEDLNDLNRDLESLEKRYGSMVQTPNADLVKVREALALNLEKGMQKYGLRKGAPASGKVHVNLKRGVYITPMDTMIFKGIEDNHEPVQAWKDGFVTMWEDWDFQSLEARGKKVHVLYLDENEFYGDYLSYTAAQRARQYAKRLKPVSSQSLAEQLANRQLSLVLAEFLIGPALEKTDPALASEIESHSKLETEALRSGLAIAAASDTASTPSLPKGFSFQESGEKGFSEISFWLSWAQANQWADVLPELEKIHIAKRKFVDDLKAAKIP